ncbi:MAG: hypothetical protein UY81_C0070G0003 [Candidatus Giovannonibacteria bacterium GW2011_GWA2_53_7]|uniref:Uncharacterized protein n=1 Tax=Candidatus Giovannonibacteria bacterium GW2011_GWA2_53_7 TaxID=1618650 RepID=A0A0G2AP75_9BACT|nr:MAG: hypothetical protein UY81_C0070G0003 [Candidatus Giovannonibacteria bacterium GW2011_GWA2_53_7]
MHETISLTSMANILRQAGYVVIPPMEDSDVLREQAIQLLMCAGDKPSEIRRLLGWSPKGDALATRAIKALPFLQLDENPTSLPRHYAEYKDRAPYFWVILCRGRSWNFGQINHVGDQTLNHLLEALHRLELDFGIPETHNLVIEARHRLGDDRFLPII